MRWHVPILGMGMKLGGEAMDAKKKSDFRARLKRVAGQVLGIQRMVDDERSCIDVVMQVNAARAALAKVSRLLLHEHLETSVAEIVGKDGRSRRQPMQDLMRVLDRFDR